MTSAVRDEGPALVPLASGCSKTQRRRGLAVWSALASSACKATGCGSASGWTSGAALLLVLSAQSSSAR